MAYNLPPKSDCFKCECHSHMLWVDRDEDDGSYNLTIFKLQCRQFPLPWKERIRWCWNILKTGSAYTDQIILSPKNALKLSAVLTVGNVDIGK